MRHSQSASDSHDGFVAHAVADHDDSELVKNMQKVTRLLFTVNDRALMMLVGILVLVAAVLSGTYWLRCLFRVRGMIVIFVGIQTRTTRRRT